MRTASTNSFAIADTVNTGLSSGLAKPRSDYVARVAYQRLALRIEERDFEQVLMLASHWAAAFRRLGLPEDALKCRFLEVVRHAGRQCAHLQVTFEINSQPEGSPGSITMKLSGDLYEPLDLKRSLARSLPGEGWPAYRS